MSDTFNIKRFGKVLQRDLFHAYKNLFITICVFLGILLGFWILVLFGSDGISPNDRLSLIHFLCIVIAIASPFKLFGQIGREGQGLDFVMVPASNPEKFLSMILTACLLPTLIYLIGALALDSLLCLIPVHAENTTLFELPAFLRTSLCPLILKCVVYSAFALMGAVWFRKHQVIWTAALFLLVHLILLLGFIYFLLIYKDMNIPSKEMFISLVHNVYNSIYWIMPAEILIYWGIAWQIMRRKRY